MRKIVILTAMAALLLAGCATYKIKQYEKTAQSAIGLINAGDFGGLAGLTQVPFLLDAEIIMLDKDMRDFWRIVTEAGFKPGDVTALESKYVDENSYKTFGENMEVDSYFKNYVSDQAMVVTVKTNQARFYFLINTEKKKKKIMGFKGPEAL